MASKRPRKKKQAVLRGVSLPVRREAAGTPLREWLYLADAATSLVFFAGANDSEFVVQEVLGNELGRSLRMDEVVSPNTGSGSGWQP